MLQLPCCTKQVNVFLLLSCLDGCCAMPLQQDLVESSCVVDKQETKDMCSLNSFTPKDKIMWGIPMELVVFFV